VTVSSDASSYGLGAVLLQSRSTADDVRAIAFASRTLYNAEKRYAQIEKECLAAVCACEKFNQFLVGLPFFVLQTDHKPLIPLLMTKDLNQVPVRYQRLLMRMMRFNPRAVYVPGKSLVVADMLSRAPLNRVDEQDKVEGVQFYVDTMVAKLLSVDRLSEVRQATAVDSELQAAIGYTLEGWPQSSKALAENLRRYLSDHLSFSDGLLLYDDRIYIPRSLQANQLERIHDGHQGVTKCRDRTRSFIYWLGISQDVKTYVDSCSFCQENQRRLQ